MNKDYLLLNEVARAVPCKPFQIAYLISVGVIEEPTLRINNKRIFRTEDVDHIREIFERRKAKKEAHG